MKSRRRVNSTVRRYLEMRLQRTIIGGITGACCGALFGSAFFAVATYVLSAPYMGWAMFVAFWSGVWCAAVGSIVGTVIGVADLRKVPGTFVGTVPPLLLICYALVNGFATESRSIAAFFALSYICLGAAVGLLTVVLTSKAVSWLRPTSARRAVQ
jgi:hypothetical protein